ncbi:MAG: T9SS type A sorting domain-containing protein [Lewinellaceae bacterium]|nr:T9SS type A sorting domain-containing protein [Lewinellaceae bacterium]MCB9354562.1 T9SS type A sorting domain-containing protein [Lewinellaceae bacterium]
MMKLLFFLVICFPSTGPCQGYFSRNIDLAGYADAAWQIIDKDSSYYIVTTSYCDLSPYACVGLIKLDANLEVVWKRSYEEISLGAYTCMAAQDSSILFIGNSAPAVDTLEVTVVKTDLDGNVLAQWYYGTANQDQALGMAAASGGGFVFIAREVTGINKGKLWLYRCAADGGILWRRRYGEQYRTMGVYSITQASDGGYVLGCSGCFEPDCHWREGFVLKIDSLGNKLFKVVRDSSDGLGVNCYATHTYDGGAVMSRYTDIDDPPFYRPILYRVDSSGEELWRYETTSPEFHFMNSVKTAQNGDFIGVGFDENHPFFDTIFELSRNFGGWILRLSPDGKKKWERIIGDLRFPGDAFGEIFDVVEKEDGSLVAVGTILDTFSSGIPTTYNRDVWLLHLDSNGCVIPGCDDLFQGVVSLKELQGFSSSPVTFYVYPNPASGRVYIVPSNSEPLKDDFLVTLTNLLGEVVYRDHIPKGTLTHHVPLYSLSDGLYFLALSQPGSYRQTLCIVVHHD